MFSAGVAVDGVRRMFGSLRVRYFGARPLTEDNTVRSRPTTLVNVEGGFKLTLLKEEEVNLETAFMRLTKGMVQ